jgi:hypothetical protein
VSADVSGEDEIVFATSIEDLPEVGNEEAVYKIGSSLYTWNTSTGSYEQVGMNINVINGGNSNG